MARPLSSSRRKPGFRLPAHIFSRLAWQTNQQKCTGWRPPPRMGKLRASHESGDGPGHAQPFEDPVDRGGDRGGRFSPPVSCAPAPSPRARAARRRRTRRRPTNRFDLRPCAVCGDYVDGAAPGCGREDCPRPPTLNHRPESKARARPSSISIWMNLFYVGQRKNPLDVWVWQDHVRCHGGETRRREHGIAIGKGGALQGTSREAAGRHNPESMGCGHRAPAGFARIRSHQAFAAAGADVLYAPGIGDLATIEAVVSAVSKPVNVVMTNADPSITAETPASVGVKLISVGGSIARYAMAAFLGGGARNER